MEYDDRMAELEKVEHPKPNADFIYETFNAFADQHPWLDAENVKPKSIAREMYERGATFDEYVRDYSLERAEGVLLRYLSEAWRVLDRTIPSAFHDDAFLDLVAYLRATLDAVDSSLVDEWEAMRHPEELAQKARHMPVPPRRRDPAADPRAFTARLRAELHQLARHLGRKAWEDALAVIHDPEGAWTPERLAQEIEPLFVDHGGLDLTPRGREARLTTVKNVSPRVWDCSQRLLAQDGDDFWFLDAYVDLTEERAPEAPLISLRRIGT
jgi:hypothetical protein